MGGMSWETTMQYYSRIQQKAAEVLGPNHTAPCLIYSIPFHELIAYQEAGDWKSVGAMMAEAGQALERSGAEAVAFCSNTVHKETHYIRSQLQVPMLSIVDAVKASLPPGIKRPFLLGTAFTMQAGFYQNEFAAHGIEIALPQQADQEKLHQLIFGELCRGNVTPQAQQWVTDLLGDAAASQQVDAVIFGCTELDLLHVKDAGMPVISSTQAHIQQITDFVSGHV